MTSANNKRQQQKAESLEKILAVSARRLREEGIQGTGISSVMAEAGLTHGGFYAHFANKDDLNQAAFRYAVEKNQPGWFQRGRRKQESFATRLKRLAKGYLTTKHRDHVGESCAISALASEVSQADEAFRQTYSSTVEATLQEIAQNDPEHLNDAIAFFSLCVGGLLLSRGVTDPKLSRKILSAARGAVDSMAEDIH